MNVETGFTRNLVKHIDEVEKENGTRRGGVMWKVMINK
jgi:hypothetical protein